MRAEPWEQIGALIRRHTHSTLFVPALCAPPPHEREPGENVYPLQARERAPPDWGSASTFIWHFPALRTVGNKCFLWKPRRLCYFVAPAQADPEACPRSQSSKAGV